MAKRQATIETFTLYRVSGVWEYASKKDTPTLYRQERDNTGKISVRVSRLFTRDRNGKKLEKVSQVITGEMSAVSDYVSTFPPVVSVRVSSLVSRAGMQVNTEY